MNVAFDPAMAVWFCGWFVMTGWLKPRVVSPMMERRKSSVLIVWILLSMIAVTGVLRRPAEKVTRKVNECFVRVFEGASVLERGAQHRFGLERRRCP